MPDTKQSVVSQITDLKRLPYFSKLIASVEIPRTLFNVQDCIDKMVQHPLLHTYSPLEGRSSIIRSQETNLGNMLADAVRAFYGTQIAFVNSGSVRCNRIIGPTDVGVNPLCVKDVIGKLLHVHCRANTV